MSQIQPLNADGATLNRAILPPPPPAFRGTIGQTYKDSRPYYAPQVKAPAGAPNVVVVLTDDVGFGAASTFGGPVPTPNLDRLAARGLRYTRFHTTAMCSPTRASLLTGRNHHAVGAGIVTDTASGYPGYDGAIPRSAASIAQILRYNGYSTAMIGKHHNVPTSEQSPAGPFTHWPTGLGFDHFFGFIGGDADQWRPRLYRGVELTDERPPAGETLDHILFDDAISWVHTQKAAAPDKPFFLYIAPGSAHAPHQAPAEWIAKFRGKFDSGWDALRTETLHRQVKSGIAPKGTQLTPRPDSIPAWSSLTPEDRAADARMMEVFAGMLAYQDAQFGRLLDELDRMGQSDNTLIIFIEGDNGGSAEGGIEGTLNEIGRLANNMVDTPATKAAAMDKMGGPGQSLLYPVGWSWATNSPFQWMKQVGSHLGGMRNGMVVAWPARIADKGGIRTAFSHVTDIMPTVLEAVGLPQPTSVDGVAQQPVDGVSIAYSFDKGIPEKPRTQYFELIGNRALYKDGWLANTTPGRLPWKMGGSGMSPLDYKWELYDLRTDFSQSRDLAAKEPQRLEEMKALWDEQARRNQVYPLDDRQGDRSNGVLPEGAGRKLYEYWSGGISVPQAVAPRFGWGSFSLEADVVLPRNTSHGVLAATGSLLGGWSFYLDDGKPAIIHAASHQAGDQWVVAATQPLAAGPARIRYDYASSGFGRGGKVTISVNGQQVAQGEIKRNATFSAGLSETFDTGRDTGEEVAAYPKGSEFDGTIKSIIVKLK
ncbi:arylsulfatase [Sphingobium sp.]|uniref:arylsulfatase n=1 Tax=Sphingobium sp. TaxID=1912891 RepID=UPI0035C72ED3